MSRSMLGFLQHILNETQYLMDRAEGPTKGEFLVDYDIVWDVVTTKVPALRYEIEQIIQKEQKE
jgi:hypothetical protein